MIVTSLTQIRIAEAQAGFSSFSIKKKSSISTNPKLERALGRLKFLTTSYLLLEMPVDQPLLTGPFSL
jgi:hypothetical protein